MSRMGGLTELRLRTVLPKLSPSLGTVWVTCFCCPPKTFRYTIIIRLEMVGKKKLCPPYPANFNSFCDSVVVFNWDDRLSRFDNCELDSSVIEIITFSPIKIAE